MTFARAARIADAVLLEGYVLYPYRSTATKNRYRWTFGVLAPEVWTKAGGCEESWLEAQLLVSGKSPVLRGRLRFLSVVDRTVESYDGKRFTCVESLAIEGRAFVAWEEGELHEIDFDGGTDGVTEFHVEAGEKIEILRDASGALRGRVVRTQAELFGTVRLRTEPLETPPAEEQLWRVTIRVDNLTPPELPRMEQVDRPQIMRSALVSAHLLVAAGGARFVSLFDPPPHTRDIAATCRSTRCWPVLAAEEGQDDLVLASPIILYDHPQIAPESTGDFFDACEIDEILALRTRTLTAEEKVIARATDARAAAIIDRVDAMTQEELGRLHGAIRDRPRYVPGARVRLRLDGKTRRSDVQDLLYSGCAATIHAVKKDVDGRDYLAVTIDDDPSASMHLLKGRYHYYYPDEVEPIDGPPAKAKESAP